MQNNTIKYSNTTVLNSIEVIKYKYFNNTDNKAIPTYILATYAALFFFTKLQLSKYNLVDSQITIIGKQLSKKDKTKTKRLYLIRTYNSRYQSWARSSGQPLDKHLHFLILKYII